MDSLKNKPSVFLSYSRKDEAFINKIYESLKECLIEPWMDTHNIRHGESWLDAIFESGIPTCDCVLIYLTETSIESPMVKKEINAGALSNLKDKHVGFLPYISDESLRCRLRRDIQGIQTPVWNNANYEKLLPRVVAEIWRYYFDRKINDAIKDEKVRRLELEAELNNFKNDSGGIFSKSEEADFNFIWNKFDRYDRVKFLMQGKDSKKEDEYTFEIHIQPIISKLYCFIMIDLWYWTFCIRKILKEIVIDQLPKKEVEADRHEIIALSNELLKYGLLEMNSKTEGSIGQNGVRTTNFYTLSNKTMRFTYWLENKGKLPKECKYRLIKENQNPIEFITTVEKLNALNF